jgi:hypothetical protein
MDLEPVTDWLWCLRTPLVQAYAVRQGDGFHLIDTSHDDHTPGSIAVHHEAASV